jgi:hypothetical protein
MKYIDKILKSVIFIFCTNKVVIIRNLDIVLNILYTCVTINLKPYRYKYNKRIRRIIFIYSY